MKKIWLLAVLCVAIGTRFSFANDGSFYVSGNTLIPLQETSVSLKRELLKFYVEDFDKMRTEVDFEFFNPGAEKQIIVGFVTPPADGDVSEEEEKHPRIENFTVVVNGETIPFEIKRMSETTFSMDNLKIDGKDFVYYFPVTFRKGLNKIRHTYVFQGGSGIEMQRDFDYQITTGKRWANRQIDDFELQIHLDRGIFSVPASFVKNKSANWQIVGDGVITKQATEWLPGDSPLAKMVHLNDGYLLLKEKNFRPTQDIFLGEYNWGSWIDKMCKTSAKCPDTESSRRMIAHSFSVKPDADETVLGELTGDELKIARNFAYAIRGYNFTDKTLAAFYSQFFWYKPNAALKAEDVKLSDEETAFISLVKKAEGNRKK